MARGTVKWFDQKKGYGFIQPQIVEYEEISNRGRTSVENLKVQR
jgi:cold shock protein